MTFINRWGSVATRVIAASIAASCSSQPSRSSSPPQLPTPVSPASAPLWGDLTPVVSVKELMRDMLDPASDYIFDSVSVVSNKNGTIERVPKTDEDWEKIRIGAVTIAEGVYLLKIPRPFTPAGDENNSQGPDAMELSPAQIKAKLEKDPVLWNAKIEALRNVGLEVMEIVKKKNLAELWDAGSNLDHACEQCHLEYWYPRDPSAVRKQKEH